MLVLSSGNVVNMSLTGIWTMSIMALVISPMDARCAEGSVYRGWRTLMRTYFHISMGLDGVDVGW